jgi:plastocyanin
MIKEARMTHRRSWAVGIMIAVIGAWGLWGSSPADSQSEQMVEVVIKDFSFITKQGPLRLGLPTAIKVTNDDAERHDFGSTMFEGIPTKIEKDGVIVYGRGLGGVMLDPKRDVVIRFNMERPGRHAFRCSIHPNMKGELLLLSAEAV